MMRQNCSSPPGGSAMHRTPRKAQERKTYFEKKLDARLRAESEIDSCFIKLDRRKIYYDGNSVPHETVYQYQKIN